jgi:hypothetical protein
MTNVINIIAQHFPIKLNSIIIHNEFFVSTITKKHLHYPNPHFLVQKYRTIMSIHCESDFSSFHNRPILLVINKSDI